MNEILAKDTRPLMVSIKCLAYNHESFIRQCLEGFVMQKTNFRFEAIVHDDASTDGTAAIIREYAEKYPGIIKPIYETENQYSKHDGSLRRIMNAHIHGKYVALCEGDDYWTDPLKLQKQVEFLEVNPQCALTYHACKNVFTSPCTDETLYGEVVKESYTAVETLIEYFQTATVMYRKEIADSELYKKASEIGCTSGDNVLYLTASCFGTIQGVNEQMSVYRRHPMGISQTMHGQDKIWKNFNDWLQIALLFGGDIGKWIRQEKISQYIVYSYFLRKYKLFFLLLWKSILITPITARSTIVTIISRYIGKLTM